MDSRGGRVTDMQRALLSACCLLRFSTEERKLADEFEQLLRMGGFEYEREFVLGEKDRLDFFVAGVAVEIKTASGYNAVLRQLGRYAEHERVEAVLLITTRSDHQKMPAALGGKPVTVYWVPFCA